MISRNKYKVPELRDSSKDDEFTTYKYETRIKVLSTNPDGTVDKYVEETFWKEEKSSWSEYINGFNLGSISQQMFDHLTKGTPLVTAQVLPSADYTKLEKGAEIKREMAEKGISIDMIVSAVQEAFQKANDAQAASEGN